MKPEEKCGGRCRQRTDAELADQQPQEPNVQQMDDMQRNEVFGKIQAEPLVRNEVVEVRHRAEIAGGELGCDQIAEVSSGGSEPRPTESVQVVILEVTLVGGVIEDQEKRGCRQKESQTGPFAHHALF